MYLRSFIPDDWQTISRHQYSGMSEDQVKILISQWNTKQYSGQYFEQLAIIVDKQVVGYVSLMDQADGIVSEGVEIYTPYRRRGFAYQALTLLIQYARDLGYRTITAQIRQDNAASLSLHEKLGFIITDHFINKRGNPVFTLSLSLRNTAAGAPPAYPLRIKEEI